jgi:signal transduction histidine kinase
LQQIIDVLPEALVVVDEAGNLTLQNQAAQQLLGTIPPGGNVLRHNATVLHRRDGSLAPLDSLPLRKVLDGGEPVLGERFVVQFEAAAEKPVLANAVALRNGDGLISGAAVIFQDISVLDDLNRQKEEFLAALAHDLKTPLTVILGRTRILERRAARLPTTEEAQFFEELLGSIGRSTWRATSLVNSMLDSARMEMGSSLDLNREQISLNQIIEDLAKDFTALTDRHELRLQLDGTPFGYWDRERIMRVLANLLENAVKYSPDGGLVVIQTRVSAEPSGGDVTIDIADEGIGIPPRDQARIFEPFFRAQNASPSFAGTGLGLFASKKIIEAHQGTISVQSKVNAGSLFSIRLPLTSTGEPIVVPPPDAAGQSS